MRFLRPVSPAGELTVMVGATSTVSGERGPLDFPRVRPAWGRIIDEAWVAWVAQATMIRPTVAPPGVDQSRPRARSPGRALRFRPPRHSPGAGSPTTPWLGSISDRSNKAAQPTPRTARSCTAPRDRRPAHGVCGRRAAATLFLSGWARVKDPRLLDFATLPHHSRRGRSRRDRRAVSVSPLRVRLDIYQYLHTEDH